MGRIKERIRETNERFGYDYTEPSIADQIRARHGTVARGVIYVTVKILCFCLMVFAAFMTAIVRLAFKSK